MYLIARKNTLGMHLRKLRKEFPAEYNFFPHTWLYPSDLHEIQEYNNRKYKQRNEEIQCGLMTQEQSNADPPIMFIVKPEAGCQGKGIFIAKSIEELQRRVDISLKRQVTAYNEYLKAEENFDTAQRYGDKEKKDLVEEAPDKPLKDNSYVV